jgi:hypothetical protein
MCVLCACVYALCGCENVCACWTCDADARAQDYFDEKPIGCCYNKQQQAVWDKWNLLKKRVAKLEGQVHYL